MKWATLQAIAEARHAPRLPADQMEKLILALLREAGDLTRSELAVLLQRDASKLGERFLNPMVERGQLVRMLQPPSNPNQRYTLAPGST